MLAELTLRGVSHTGQRGKAVAAGYRTCRRREEETPPISSEIETGNVTGTQGQGLIWFTEACLNNALRLDTDIQDASAMETSTSPTSSAEHKVRAARAEQGKQLLASRLQG